MFSPFREIDDEAVAQRAAHTFRLLEAQAGCDAVRCSLSPSVSMPRSCHCQAGASAINDRRTAVPLWEGARAAGGHEQGRMGHVPQ